LNWGVSAFFFQTYFGFSGFRSYQREIIQKVLEGRDCLVVMATGSGKSIW
jgi:ATP-dependent DNA helicase RecQ